LCGCAVIYSENLPEKVLTTRLQAADSSPWEGG